MTSAADNRADLLSYDALSPATVWDLAKDEPPARAKQVADELARRDAAEDGEAPSG